MYIYTLVFVYIPISYILKNLKINIDKNKITVPIIIIIVIMNEVIISLHIISNVSSLVNI